MTKKDYELIAQVLKDSRFCDASTIAWRMAMALERENPRFRTSTFLKAAGLVHDGGK